MADDVLQTLHSMISMIFLLSIVPCSIRSMPTIQLNNFMKNLAEMAGISAWDTIFLYYDFELYYLGDNMSRLNLLPDQRQIIIIHTTQKEPDKRQFASLSGSVLDFIF